MTSLIGADLPAPLLQIGGYAGSRLKGRPDPPLPFIAEKVTGMPEIQRMITFKFAPGSGDMIYVDQPPKTKGTRLMLWRPLESQQLLLIDGTATGLEFHPDFEQNGFLYLGYWGPQGAKRGERICKVTRYTLKDGRLESPRTIIEWESNGHNGLGLAFGSDGMFYVTTGDGTSDSDTDITGQDLTKLLAKVLRIDVENPANGKAYSVPPDNPFVGEKNIRPETFAYGLRNPWRACWDHRLNRLWVGNNGQDRLEQAYLVERGANYGWSVYEGSRIFYANRKLGPHPVSPPTVEHDHGESRSLTGGVVYTGQKHPELKDAYIYGDNTTGKIWAVLHDGEKVVWNREIADTDIRITDFAVDPKSGDLLVSDYRLGEEGGLYRLVPNPKRGKQSSFPRRLSETGLFRSTAKHEVVSELLPYDVNIPEWADGASIQRFLMLPAEEAYLRFATRRGWSLPDNTVALQTLALGDTRIETRMLVKQEAEWAAYTYRWNDLQTDAELVGAKGADIKVKGRNWHIPSRAECMICHSRAANFVLGLQSAQLNRDYDYHGTELNQLDVMNRLGFFMKPDAKKPISTMRQAPDELDAFARITDESADLDQRARSLLHARCAHCHVPAGGGNAQMDLRYFVESEKMGVFNETPYHGDLGFGPDAKIVVPGHPEKSVLLNRCSRVGPGQMPPLGSQTPDPRAVGLLAEWILASAAKLSWPPTKFDRPASLDLLLQPTETLREDVAIASAPPKVSFHYYNCQTYEPDPGVWSVWGDGLVVSNKYYSAVGDHSSPGGNAFVY
ncbi:MAG: PQQ-dependent sugar dehydrogenase, partial [Limisphaerales bacterium]